MSEPQTTPPPAPGAPPPAGASDNRNIMIALAYIIFLVPLLLEKDDKEVQWHAKHGLVLFIVEVVLFVGLGILASIPGVGCILMFGIPILAVGVLILHIAMILKGINGGRLTIPGISEWADKL
ncbi:MAG TPA: hypothetical protein VF017_04375 [Thermoanaerobaculia bacterium]|nr:hypothetical protein [Thermoanaerobaculia bacterium]